MIDRIFFMLLFPLPVVVAIGAIIYGLAAWRTRTPSLRTSRTAAAIWLGASSFILFYARERVRNWSDFDNAFAATVFILFAGFAVFLGAALGFFALLGRSTRGSGLCPNCWYDMTGVLETTETVCPECGTGVRAHSDLAFRRRWPVLIAVAIVIQLAGQFTYQLIRADHSGVNAFVPTTALVAGMYSLPRESIIGGGGVFDTETLTGRLLGKGSSEWQRSWAVGKAVTGLCPGSSRETVLRAASLLNRCSYEGELPIAHWQSAVMALSAPGDSASEPLAYLAESYIRTRTSGANFRFGMPTDAALSERELAPIVPQLFALLKSSRPRTSEWWNSVQLLALAGPSAAPVVDYLESRVLLEDSDNARGSSAIVLANLASRFQDAQGALSDVVISLDATERSRVLLTLSRSAPDNVELAECFRALASCGEPVLENIGADGLACAPSTRCEGVLMLTKNFAKHQRWVAADIWSLYWPILRFPDDGASDQLVSFLADLALNATPELRDDAMSVLISVGRASELRNTQVIAIFDLLGQDLNRSYSEKARAAAKDLRANGTIPVPRKVAVIK